MERVHPHSRASACPPVRLERLFENQAARTPTAIAILFRGVPTTYADLDAQANRIAHMLLASQIGRETRVAIHMGRSVQMVATLLGVLKAGAAYVPLDPCYPADRLAFILADSGSTFVVSDEGVPLPFDHNATMLDVSSSSQHSSTRNDVVGSEQDLAYVLYTSGSTGTPKGVMLEHTAARLIEWITSEFTPTELSMTAAGTSICFDPHVIELFAPLSMGGTVLLRESPHEPFAPDERPTLMAAVPSVVVSMLDRGLLPSSLRAIIIGGDRLTAQLVQRIRRETVLARIHNHYGPTEATTCVAAAWVDNCDDGSDPPLGTAICENILLVVGEDGREVADNVEGELYIAGPMLARGYVNDSDDTDAGFLALPDLAAGHVYRTGDVVRRRSEGDFDYVGRVGDFVKLNGRRVAPAEVEAAILRLPGIRQVAVTHGLDDRGHGRLIAHVVAELDAEPITLGALRAMLRPALPHAILPSVLNLCEAMPLTVNGKIDRRALPGVPSRSVPSPADPVDYHPIVRAVADVFAQELALLDVHSDDDFFELGGDSLSVVAVALDLETVLGRAVSPALIYHAPTPRLLHQALRDQPQVVGGHLVCLQAEGTEPPLYCLPDIHGRPMSFITLARHFTPSQPVFGLVIGPSAHALIRRPSMESVIPAYVAAILAATPTGPIHVAGYSFGGTFAQEVARLLEESGRTVSLVLLDAPNRKVPLRPLPILRWSARSMRTSLHDDGLVATAGRIRRRLRDLAPYVLMGDNRMPRWLPSSDFALAKAYVGAEVAHHPRAFYGRTLVVTCRSQKSVNVFRHLDNLLGWRGLLRGPVTSLVVDVAHHDLVRTSQAPAIADAMRRFFAGENRPAEAAPPSNSSVPS